MIATVNENLLPAGLIAVDTGTLKYKSFAVENGTYTMFTPDSPAVPTKILFFLPGKVTSGASSNTNGVDSATPRTITVTNGFITVAFRIQNQHNPEDDHWFIVRGDKPVYAMEADSVRTVTTETIAAEYDHYWNTATPPKYSTFAGRGAIPVTVNGTFTLMYDSNDRISVYRRTIVDGALVTQNRSFNAGAVVDFGDELPGYVFFVASGTATAVTAESYPNLRIVAEKELKGVISNG